VEGYVVAEGMMEMGILLLNGGGVTEEGDGYIWIF